MKPSPRRTAGYALPLLLAILLLGSSLFFRLAPADSSPASAGEAFTTVQLMRAKEALLARAVGDANRPGSLPCPDLLTDDTGLNNFPGDGKADNLTRNDCPTYLGWLPWVTLDLGDLRDASGHRLWYAVSRGLRDDDNASALNSDFIGELTVNDQSDIAAILIAPGPPISGQQRPSNLAQDYLDGSNADGNLVYSQGPVSASFNDQIAIITRQELMAAVEKRIANEVLRCLNAHFGATGSDPWPAPLTASNRRGRYASHFGQIPLTQPNSGPQQTLSAFKQEAEKLQQAIPNDISPNMSLAPLNALLDPLSALTAYADQLYAVAKQGNQLAASAWTLADRLVRQSDTALDNLKITATERNTVTNTATLLMPAVDAVISQLIDSGLDPFPQELESIHIAVQALREQYAAAPGVPPPELAILFGNTANWLSGSVSPDAGLNSELVELSNRTQQAVDRLTLATQNPGAGPDALLAVDNWLAQANAVVSSVRQARPATYPPGIAGDDISRYSLEQLASQLRSQLLALTQASAPTSDALVPYVQSLRHTAYVTRYWIDMLVRQSTSTALLARKSTASSSPENPESLYQHALSASGSLDGSSGTLSKLASYLASPSRSDRQAAARSALDNTRTQVAATIATIDALATQLESSAAEAFPMIWHHRACDFVQAKSSTSSWWTNQGWPDFVFYQFVRPGAAEAERLRINERAAVDRVVLLAGKALNGQNRSLRAIDQYFEGKNASSTRNGNAEQPDRDFSQSPVSSTFNDRISY